MLASTIGANFAWCVDADADELSDSLIVETFEENFIHCDATAPSIIIALHVITIVVIVVFVVVALLQSLLTTML